MVYRRFIFLLYLGIGLVCSLGVQAQTSDVDDSERPWLRKEKNSSEKTQKKQTSNQTLYRRMARDLLGQPHWSDRFLNLLDRDVPKIAIAPIREEDMPISSSEGQGYLDGFVQALVREAGDRYGVVGRRELGALVKEIDNMGTRTQSVNPLGDLFDRARSDLLAVHHWSLKGDKIVLSIKMVETESGRIVSSTQRSLKRSEKSLQQQAGGLSVDGAVNQAVDQLLRDAGELKSILVQGVRYQDTGVHSPFGRYLMGRLGDAFRQKGTSGPRNINDLNISDFVVREESFRGLILVGKSVEQSALSGREGNYILKGNYWVFDQTIELRLALENEHNQSIAWRGKILKSDIPPEIDLVPPPAPIGEDQADALGPIDLYLSSNKGDNPQYRIGEEMILSVQVKQDSYLSCYYFQADDVIFRIFPNRHIHNNLVNGGFTYHIPSKGMGFSFAFIPPAGVEAVKCYASDQDVSDEIFKTLGQQAFQPLPLKSERELTHLYRSLPNITLSEASLIVSVYE